MSNYRFCIAFGASRPTAAAAPASSEAAARPSSVDTLRALPGSHGHNSYDRWRFGDGAAEQRRPARELVDVLCGPDALAGQPPPGGARGNSGSKTWLTLPGVAGKLSRDPHPRSETADGDSRPAQFFFDLLPLPSPLPSTPGSTSSSSTFGTYSLLLSQSRSSYSALRERYLRAPDGRWVQDEDSPQGPPVPEKGSGPAGAPRLAKVQVKGNNPLGLEEENPWISWFEDLELRKVIRQDVLRT